MISEELRKKVGQMMMCGFPSTVLDDQVRKLVDDFYVGNFIYFSRNCDTAGQTASLSADISHLVYDKLGIAPLISIDQEGGGVSRLVEGAALMSGASAVSGAVTELTPENVERVRQLGRICGRVLRSCGINLNNAPSMDVNIEPANPVIGARSYSDDPERVAQLATAMTLGMKDAGVIGAIKHFPGHGNVNSDSHLGIPTNNTEYDSLMQTEFKPFSYAIEAGAEAVMSCHVCYTKVDPETPGTLSRTIQTGLLRDTFGFKGISMTDCMEMEAIHTYYPDGEGAVRAIEAGIDILTISHTYQAASDMANAIYRALESGRLTEERINRSYERIIAAKERMGLLCRQEIHPEKAMAEALNPENVAFTRALAQDAQAVLQGTLNLTPDETLLVVAPTQRPTTGAEDMKPLSFADEVEKAWGTRGVGTMDFSPSVTEEEMAAVCAQVEEKVSQGCSQVLLGLFNCRFRRIHLQLLRDLEQKAREGKVKLTVALLGAPYDLNLIEGDETVVTCFEYTPLSVSGLIYALEQNRFPGKNPYGRMK